MEKTKSLLRLPQAILSRWCSIATYAVEGVTRSLRSGQQLNALKIIVLASCLALIVIFSESCRVFDRSTAGQEYDATLNNLNQKGR